MKATAAIAGVGLLLALAALAPGVNEGADFEVVATGIPRPLALLVDGRGLVILSPGRQGDSAGELYRLRLDGELPVDLSRQPRVRIPFPDTSLAALGSLALHPQTRELFLGEENGRRVYRLTDDGRLVLYATGAHRLSGGSTLAFDRLGRLVIVDHVDPALSEDEERPPPGLEQFREEAYRGPLVFRLTLDPSIPLPRRLGRLTPLFPRGWGGPAGGALLPHLICVSPSEGDELVFLTSSGELYRLGGDGRLSAFGRLPSGQYHRIHMATAPDGSIFISGGFHVGRVFRLSPGGEITVVASNIADPEGIALDARGDLYVAESSLHRIVRLRALQHGGR